MAILLGSHRAYTEEEILFYLDAIGVYISPSALPSILTDLSKRIESMSSFLPFRLRNEGTIWELEGLNKQLSCLFCDFKIKIEDRPLSEKEMIVLLVVICYSSRGGISHKAIVEKIAQSVGDALDSLAARGLIVAVWDRGHRHWIPKPRIFDFFNVPDWPALQEELSVLKEIEAWLLTPEADDVRIKAEKSVRALAAHRRLINRRHLSSKLSLPAAPAAATILLGSPSAETSHLSTPATLAPHGEQGKGTENPPIPAGPEEADPQQPVPGGPSEPTPTPSGEAHIPAAQASL